MKPHERIFVALDTPDAGRALGLARALRGRVGGAKIGLELFAAAGPDIVREIRSLGVDVFLDLKLHDIPNTVAGAAAAAARLDVRYLTVHALGGIAMVRAAVEAATAAVDSPPVVLAVSVLTSHDDASLERLGLAGPCRPAVLRLTGLAREAGAGGVVCSPLEVPDVRRAFADAVVVVPGIRPASWSPGRPDDQARTATPASAVAAGADLLVVGRPITAAPDPAAAAQAVADEIRP